MRLVCYITRLIRSRARSERIPIEIGNSVGIVNCEAAWRLQVETALSRESLERRKCVWHYSAGCIFNMLNHSHVKCAGPATRALIGLFVLMLGALAHAADVTSVERRKIEYLIASIETLPDASHLRLKLRSAGSRVVTAEDFIHFCASASSVSGTRYQIRFANGRAVSSETYLRQKLAEFEP